MGLARLTWEVIKKLPLAAGLDYAKEYGKQEGKNPDKAKLTNAFEGLKKTFPKKAYDKLMSAFKAGQGSTSKAEGGMMNARKKGMGLEMAEGGIALKLVPSDKKGLKKLPKKVRNKMGFMKKGGAVKKRAKSSSKKSRGTGAAIRGTKFKGVF